MLDEAGETERVQIEEGLASDAGFRNRFQQFKKAWDASLQLAHTPAADDSAAWQRFKNRITYRQQQPKAPARMRLLKVAAAVALLVCAGSIAAWLFTKNTAPGEIIFQTAGQVLNDTLPDASVVTLNKNSSLIYPKEFKGDERAVALKGEAFFIVTANKKKPFVISVGGAQVKVVGTSFNINANGGGIEVVVETGIVQLLKDKQVLPLYAGERAVLAQNASAWVKEKAAGKLYNYYRTKEFVCDNTPLWKLVEKLNEAYGSTIVISNNAIRNLPITTTFYNEPLDQVLLVISETLNIKVVKKDNSWLLQ